MQIVYKSNNEVTSSEIISLFKRVGWNKNPDDIWEAFQKSYYVTAYCNDELIGFARAISDGHYYSSISHRKI